MAVLLKRIPNPPHGTVGLSNEPAGITRLERVPVAEGDPNGLERVPSITAFRKPGGIDICVTVESQRLFYSTRVLRRHIRDLRLPLTSGEGKGQQSSDHHPCTPASTPWKQTLQALTPLAPTMTPHPR